MAMAMAELHRHEAERDPFGLPAAEHEATAARRAPAGGSPAASRLPPAVAAMAADLRHSASAPSPGGFVQASGSQRRLPGLLEQPQHQGDRERARREGDDDPGDDHRLRHGIGLQSGRRAFSRDDAEHQENAAADKVERKNFAQRLRVAMRP